jgi:hypothetical protein
LGSTYSPFSTAWNQIYILLKTSCFLLQFQMILYGKCVMQSFQRIFFSTTTWFTIGTTLLPTYRSFKAIFLVP